MMLFLLLIYLGIPSSSGSLDRFSYGRIESSEFNEGNPRIIAASDSFSEACEGETIFLNCGEDQIIKLGKHDGIRFGRNGTWESSTSCTSSTSVSHCTDISAKRILEPCNLNKNCTITIKGEFRGTSDPCPLRTRFSSSKPQKYLQFRYKCVEQTNNKRNIKDDNISNTNHNKQRNPGKKLLKNSGNFLFPSKYDDLSEVPGHLENETRTIFEKIDATNTISEDLTASVSEYLEKSINSMKLGSRMFSSVSPVSILNITESISRKLQSILDTQDGNMTECEISTSQMTLKIIKQKSSESDKTDSEKNIDWTSNTTRVSLPVQNELKDDSNEIKITLASYRNLHEELASVSDVITVSVNKQVNLSEPVEFYLYNNGTQNVSCAYWSFLLENWQMDGCITLCHNDTHTKCSCDHLTNFALIFNVHENFIGEDDLHGVRLTMITVIGLSISIACLVLTTLLFLAQWKTLTDRDMIHVNLCISLLTAELVFLFGIQETRDSVSCMLIACALHYSLLASFSWMFIEGYQIYLLLVKVFDQTTSTMQGKLIAGYLVPLAIVLLCFIADFIYQTPTIEDLEDMCYRDFQRSSYGTKDYCWLRVDNYFIFSFILPAAFVILSNLLFLVLAVQRMIMHKLLTGDARGLLVSYMKGVGLLLCLLGSTWISGLLYLVFNNVYLAYTFTLLNSLQGVGIFIFQGLMNRSLRSGLRCWFTCGWNKSWLYPASYTQGPTFGVGDGNQQSQSFVGLQPQSKKLLRWSNFRRNQTKENEDNQEIENVQEAFLSTKM